jgi:hypothetical protein
MVTLAVPTGAFTTHCMVFFQDNAVKSVFPGKDACSQACNPSADDDYHFHR